MLSIRARFVAYLVVVHVLFGALAVVLLFGAYRNWLIVVELVFAASLATGLALTRLRLALGLLVLLLLVSHGLEDLFALIADAHLALVF